MQQNNNDNNNNDNNIKYIQLVFNRQTNYNEIKYYNVPLMSKYEFEAIQKINDEEKYYNI